MTSVAFLIDQLFGPAPGGQGTYIRELIPALTRVDPSLAITLVHSKFDSPRRNEPWMDRYWIERLPWTMRRAYPSWALTGRPRLPQLIESINILHAPTPAGVPPAGPRQGTVVTVHDIAFISRPELFPWRWRLTYRAGLRRAIRTADAIIAVSQSTKNDLLERTGVDAARVSVIPLAASLPETAVDSGETLAGLGVRSPFILFVGTLEPRKNVVALVRAYRRLAARGFDHQLLLAGEMGWKSSPLKRELAQSGPGTIRRLGRIDDAALDALYRGAAALVYPSLYEGFGLPVLEAMARGIPCVVSNTTSMPEVAGDAAILVDPRSVDDLATAIERVAGDRTLRERLRADGLARAAGFSWEETARRTLDVYKSIL